MNSRRDLSLPLASLIVIVATLLAFWPVLKADFSNWDDYETVSRNPWLNPVRGQSFVQFWTRPHMELYVPVTYSVWAFTANVARLAPPPPGAPIPESGLDPRVFHGLNLALHLAAACLALLLLREFVGTNLSAAAGTLIFALHPLGVEAVAWVSGTKDVLFALLALVALWQYVRYVKTTIESPGLMLPSERWRMLGVATAAFVLAMLAKPTAVVVPPIAFALDVLLLRRRMRDALKTLWPALLLMIPCIVWTKLIQTATQASGAAPPLWLRPVVALDALAFYLWKLIAPLGLVIDHGRTPDAIIRSGMIRWTWIAPAALALLLLWLARRGQRVPLVAAVVSVLAVGPVLGFVPFSFQAYSTVANHYFYLAMLGPALLVAWLMDRAARRGMALVTVAVIAIALAVLSHRQAWRWRDTQTLLAWNLKVNPNSFAAMSNLAADALDNGDYDRAIELSNKAMNLNSQDAAPYLTFADAMRNKGNLPAAQDGYREALLREPNYGPALNNLAAMLAMQGEIERALPFAERAARVQPDLVEAQLNLGKMYFQRGQLEDARRQFQKVLKLDPGNRQARELLSSLP